MLLVAGNGFVSSRAFFIRGRKTHCSHCSKASVSIQKGCSLASSLLLGLVLFHLPLILKVASTSSSTSAMRFWISCIAWIILFCCLNSTIQQRPELWMDIKLRLKAFLITFDIYTVPVNHLLRRHIRWFYTVILVYNRAFFGAAKPVSIWVVFNRCLSKQYVSGNTFLAIRFWQCGRLRRVLWGADRFIEV